MDLWTLWWLALNLIFTSEIIASNELHGDLATNYVNNRSAEIIDLPLEHLQFYFNNNLEHVFANEDNEQGAEAGAAVVKAKVKDESPKPCWGYEDDCEEMPMTDKRSSGVGTRKRYSTPICDEDSKGWVKTKAEQIAKFYSQADFGYVKNTRDSIQEFCTPQHTGDSSLECSENLTFCRGRNLMIDFRKLVNRSKPIMYDTDVLSYGEIGGHCKLNSAKLKENLQYISSLQSWAPELQHFIELPQQLKRESIRDEMCDQVVDRKMFIMKIDATVNMYHHFCDFFNLYASLHTNYTKLHPEIFSRDVQILIWRSFKYQSSFGAAFDAFSTYPLLDLSDFAGKRVCFSDVVFPLLPRMIFGLYYNTPLIWGCRSSGLFHAFSKFMLHRLRIKQRAYPDPNRIRVTFLSRKSKYRRVLNEDILIAKLRENSQLDVRKVEFTFETDFLEQVQIVQDTDIFIGIHGAGLTHLLFLPDWAVVFEIYHCEDPNCYNDLARLRGLKYLTWRDESKLKIFDKDPELETTYFHKHANYKFNPKEFLIIANEGVNHVKSESRKFIRTHDEL